MADPSALIDGVLNLLQAHASLAGDVWDGDTNWADDSLSLDDADPPWVQFTADPGFRDSTSWTGEHDLIDFTVTTICVGSSARTARRVADWVTEALLGVRPVAAGWETYPIHQGPGRNAVEDIDIPTLWHVTPTWRIRGHA